MPGGALELADLQLFYLRLPAQTFVFVFMMRVLTQTRKNLTGLDNPTHSYWVPATGLTFGAVFAEPLW